MGQLSHMEICPREGAKLTSICEEEKCDSSREFLEKVTESF